MPLNPQKTKIRDKEYGYWMELINQDWENAAIQFINKLKSDPKYVSRSSETIRSLESILAGETDAWQKGSGVRDAADATRFVISNALLRGMGIGVIPPRRAYYEDIVNIVASIMTEDIDFVPMTQAERRIKMIAESYGLAIYRLN